MTIFLAPASMAFLTKFISTCRSILTSARAVKSEGILISQVSWGYALLISLVIVEIRTSLSVGFSSFDILR